MEKELEDCGDDIEARNASQELFQKVKTWDELVALWVKFYANKICLPTYYDIWTGTNNASAFIQNNKTAMFEAGSRIAQFSLKTGLLFEDGQAGEIKGKEKQKAYLAGFAPKRLLPVIRKLAQNVNYQSGFIMTWWNEDYNTDETNYSLPEGRLWPPVQNELHHLFVTYYGAQGVTVQTNVQDAINILLNPTDSWLSERFRRRLLDEGMIGFFIVDTIFGRNIIIDVLEAFARETEIIVDKPQSRKPSIRRSMHLRSRRKTSRRKQ